MPGEAGRQQTQVLVPSSISSRQRQEVPGKVQLKPVPGAAFRSEAVLSGGETAAVWEKACFSVLTTTPVEAQ